MSESIRDGHGTSDLAKVFSDGSLKTKAITSTETQSATINGYGFNFNTGWIAGISSDSALMFFKNNSPEDFFIESIAVGLKDGSAVDIQSIYAVRNPTSISATNAISMNGNRHFGSARAVSGVSDFYKGANGATFTGGEDIALFAQNDQGRLFAGADFLLPQSSSIGVRVVTDGTFSGEFYCAVIGHLIEEL